MNGNFWKVLGMVAAGAILISLLPDIKRYVRISTM
jgi:hypothetical protein